MGTEVAPGVVSESPQPGNRKMMQMIRAIRTRTLRLAISLVRATLAHKREVKTIPNAMENPDFLLPLALYSPCTTMILLLN
jgi:hypothetical protein